MPADRDAYYDLLVSTAPRPGLVPEAMERLAPFFEHAAADQYVLRPASELDEPAAIEALALATGRPVRRIVTVSLAAPIHVPSWADRRQVDALAVDVLMCSFRDTVSAALADAGDELRERMGPRYDVLRRDFLAHLGDALWTSLENVVPESLKVPLTLNHGHRIWAALFVYLAAAASADLATMRRFGPLVTLFATALPLGERRHEPGTALVMVA